MTEQTRSSLIERFFDGEMSPAEEKEFLARYGDDPDVAARIEADLTMCRGVEAERSAMPVPPSGSRARFAAMLDALPEGGGGNGERAGTPSVAGPHPVLRRIVIAAIAAALIVVLALLLDRPDSPARTFPGTPAGALPRTAPAPDTTRAAMPATDTPRSGRVDTSRAAIEPTRARRPSSIRPAARDSAAAPVRAAGRGDSASTEASSHHGKASLPVEIEEPTINGKKP